MTYKMNVFKFFLAMDSHLFRVKKAETLKNIWKVSLLLILLTIVVYTWSALLGIGSGPVSGEAANLAPLEYEMSKLWFVVGRAGYAIIFALSVLFIPSLIIYMITRIPYRKLLILQQVVLSVMLIERAVWIPVAVYGGLDWFVSPFSFGIAASYLTDIDWLIFFFGALSLFQIWIIWFQVKSLNYLSIISKHWVWITVIGIHIIYWSIVAALAYTDNQIIGGWFA